MKDDDGQEEGAGRAGEAHLSVVPEAVEAVTVVEPDLQVTMARPAFEEGPEEGPKEGPDGSGGLASVVRLPLVSPPKDRVRYLLQRLENLERGLAEVRARLDLVSPPGHPESPFYADPSNMTDAEREDVFLGLQRLVLDRLRRADEPD